MSSTALPPDDRRDGSRFSLTLLGRFMRETKQEYPCKLVDISLGGASMMSPVAVERGERIIAYFDHVGALEGHVVRRYDGGFAMSLTATLQRREKLTQRLAELLEKGPNAQASERRSELRRTTAEKSGLTFTDGTKVACQVLDISVSGANLATEARPAIGTELVLGKMRCKAIRHTHNGIAVEFLDVTAPLSTRKFFG